MSSNIGSNITFEDIVRLVQEELVKAKAKFPEPDFLTTAMSEEAGELVRAILNHKYAEDAYNSYAEALQYSSQKSKLNDLDTACGVALDEVQKEAIQTIAMCVRLLMEGDPVHSLPPSFIYSD